MKESLKWLRVYAAEDNPKKEIEKAFEKAREGEDEDDFSPDLVVLAQLLGTDVDQAVERLREKDPESDEPKPPVKVKELEEKEGVWVEECPLKVYFPYDKETEENLKNGVNPLKYKPLNFEFYLENKEEMSAKKLDRRKVTIRGEVLNVLYGKLCEIAEAPGAEKPQMLKDLNSLGLSGQLMLTPDRVINKTAG